MSEAIVEVKASLLRRRAIEGSLGILAGVVFACLNGPWLLSLLYKPLGSSAVSCGPDVDNALSYFVKVQLAAGLVGGVVFLVGSFFFRRTLRKRREARTSAGA
ncbi:MAG TPA: hypothetical protein VJN18_23780 [Polyangiaceae bacterium]|nr:hypothetical protein [Polyangiaceae bacterium]